MKRNIASTNISFALIVIFFLFLFWRDKSPILFWRDKSPIQREGSKNAVETQVFETFKKTCTVFNAPVNEERVYKNNRIGLQFSYPINAIVCERLSPTSIDHGIEVSVWGKDDFYTSNPKSGPTVVIHVDEAFLDKLPEWITLEERSDMIGSVNAIRRQVRSSSCVRSCPEFTIFQLHYGGHAYIIEEREPNETLIQSMQFFLPGKHIRNTGSKESSVALASDICLLFHLAT